MAAKPSAASEPEAKRAHVTEGGQAGDEHPAVTRFRDYLRINTMQPTPDYEAAAVFLEGQAKDLGFEVRRWEGVPGKPAVIMTCPGTDPTLPSVVLNSHIDVVPVFEEHWKHPPFAAVKEDGWIYARGSQDMKCVGMQYLEALRELRAAGASFARTIHLTFVPDEEIGGHDGMERFVEDPLFKELNIGVALDEGLASENDKFPVYYGERVPWWVTVKCTGQPGHGSRFLPKTAMERLVGVINKFLKFRGEQEAILLNDPTKTLGDVTTVNLTMLNGGVQYNVIPAEAGAGFDMRIPPTVNLQELKATLDEWMAGEGISYTFKQVYWNNPVTDISDKNLYWSAFAAACGRCNIDIEPQIFPAATDSRYLRCANIPAIGFSPMNNTPVLLHDHNERLHEDVYIRGIAIYKEILPALANLPAIQA
ncbi:uncharacterized protein MONBRDRAFT_32786 [Monosiga brevicollis MX1]|uniref:N-acyl-aliphatic-L-amino acid amidohydrolase n=1 Tax=Monosiga brevicollis TaxID=81824 RepID=A9V1P3_MONBE|nr:uncharacterized protein MONBRDRAFT_32786 [Monosiga brevicollis MX1]EDQ88478.1 predicted protein [Monosiga brevicollis MX1]|eukprot:XP_001746582.1 hypothetical protein [Monosiga brevicollis MX1]